MKRILLPTDFSDNAFNAINYALELFKDVECTFFLLNIYTPPIYQMEYIMGSPNQLELADILKEASLTQLDKLKKKLDQNFKNPKHQFIVRSAFNTLVNEIEETIENENIDYVIMGTKGATGAKEILFGTNTVHVIKRAKRPVIAIPPNFSFEAPKEILFPTDYEIKYPKGKFDPLLQLANQFKSRINVMHVSTGYELSPKQVKNRESLQQLLGDKGLFHDLPNNEIIQAINTFQLKEKINLLVMVQNKHTFFERMFIEPVIKKIGFHINVPFMVIPHL